MAATKAAFRHENFFTMRSPLISGCAVSPVAWVRAPSVFDLGD
jgi:hypothetical protein